MLLYTLLLMDITGSLTVIVNLIDYKPDRSGLGTVVVQQRGSRCAV